MSRPLDVLVLRGAPGVGKSTMGRELRRALDQGAIVEVDDVRAMLAQVDWTSRVHHDVALDVALAAVVRFVAIGWRPAVLIDTFSRSRLTAVQTQLDSVELHHATISLWVDPALLSTRLEARTTGFKDWEPSRVLNEEVRINRYPKERLVDATRLDRSELVTLALDIIRPTPPAEAS